MFKRSEYRRRKILALLETKSKPVSARELAKELGFGFSPRDVGRQLSILYGEGKVRKTIVCTYGGLWEVVR